MCGISNSETILYLIGLIALLMLINNRMQTNNLSALSKLKN